jgi:hypothetical protein
MNETIPCKTCETPTKMLGTKLCDSCYEIESRLDSYLSNENAIKYIYSLLNKKTAKPRPMYLYEDGWHFINHRDKELTTFLWNHMEEKGEFVGEIEKIKTISGIHSYGYYGFFKPSIKEVFDCVDDWEDAIGFSIELDFSEHARYGLTKDQKHHKSIITLWRQKK